MRSPRHRPGTRVPSPAAPRRLWRLWPEVQPAAISPAAPVNRTPPITGLFRDARWPGQPGSARGGANSHRRRATPSRYEPLFMQFSSPPLAELSNRLNLMIAIEPGAVWAAVLWVGTASHTTSTATRTVTLPGKTTPRPCLSAARRHRHRDRARAPAARWSAIGKWWVPATRYSASATKFSTSPTDQNASRATCQTTSPRRGPGAPRSRA